MVEASRGGPDQVSAERVGRGVTGIAVTQERRLVEVLSEFARTMLTDFPIQGILDHLVRRIVDVLPISSAGVTLITPGEVPKFVAASDDSALQYERIQTDIGDGPCLEAYSSGEAVAVPELRSDDRFPKFARQAVEQGLSAVFTFPLRHGDQQLGALDLYRSTPGPLNPDSMAAAQTLADVTAAFLLNAKGREDLRESAERARRIALHDDLTGLPNRTLLVQRLEHAVARSARSESIVAILFADLDRFKSINDDYGHDVGDQLLIAIAQRLTHLLRPGDTLARLSGDEFVVLCEDLDDALHAGVIANRILTALADPFSLSMIEVQVTASVGIAFAGPGRHVPEQILKDADTAMYQAKRRGGGHHGIVDLDARSVADVRAGLSRDLPRAMGRGELHLEYQPIVASATGQITGAEALLRWTHPSRGMIPPETTIGLAEQSGQINQIGKWVLTRACLDRKGWRQNGRSEELAVSVNVSVRQLMAAGFTELVAEVLADTDTDPAMVTLEVTESVFIPDADRALVVLSALKDLGLPVALDDFGTGYSSLSYLKLYPIDVVKIDRSFIAGVDRDKTSRAIVRAVVQLAHGLHMTVVAEGIETVAQHEEIAALGCDAFQGHLFARPALTTNLDAIVDAANHHKWPQSRTTALSRRALAGRATG